MAIHIITIFCEGPHDVAFLTKILKSGAFKSNDKFKIGEFPLPYSLLLETEAKKSNVIDLNLQELRNTIMPSATLQKDDNFLFFYAMGGDSRKDKRQKLLSDLNSFIPKSKSEFSTLPENTILSVLYFFDADNKGVGNRLIEVGKEMNEIISEIDEKSFIKNAHKVSLFEDKLNVGVYIFYKQGEDTGKLEDILVPLMKIDNDKIFEDAERFIDENHDEARCKANNFDKKKSLVSAVGQLQKSGSSNVVCIGQTDYLSSAKIQADAQCVEIIELFNQFILI